MNKNEILEEFKKRDREVLIERCKLYNSENPHSPPIPIHDTKTQNLVRYITNKKGLESFLNATNGQAMIIIKTAKYQPVTQIESYWSTNFQTDKDIKYTIALLKEDPTTEKIESITDFYKKNIKKGELTVIKTSGDNIKYIW